MKWLEETHGPVFELTRHFVARMFDSELFAEGRSWRSAAIGALSMFLLTGVSAFYQDPLGRHQRMANGGMAAEARRMMLFLAVSGLQGVLQWHALLPSRRDYLALASLPLRPRHVFAARLFAFLILSGATVATLNALPSVFAPIAVRGHSHWANAAARAIASSLACFFALFSMVALQGALLNVAPGRIDARTSGYVQGICATVFFLAALESWHVADWAAGETFLRDYAWAPPVWFAALLRAILRGADPQVRALATRALFGFGAAFSCALAGYFVSYRRYRSLLLESSGRSSSPAARRSLITLFVRDPRRAAVFDFMDKTLARSRPHRLVLLGYAGLAFVLLINSAFLALAASRWQPDWDKLLRFMTLYWPLTAAMIVVPGMRHAPRTLASSRTPGQLGLPHDGERRPRAMDERG